uniref:Mitochondrial fission process protein 1 n=1 Tax=Dromaius novaehollandiae TaxID=8790 RepID=A0A8C4JU17_DRONO
PGWPGRILPAPGCCSPALLQDEARGPPHRAAGTCRSGCTGAGRTPRAGRGHGGRLTSRLGTLEQIQPPPASRGARGGGGPVHPGPPDPSRPPGYANEVGESFRAIVPVSLVWASYGVATAYVTADAIDKGKKAAVTHAPDAGKTARVGVAVVDTFVWQSLASVAIPGFTINRLCAASLYLLGSLTRWPLPLRKWTTTALGLSAIPFIVKPIDRTVDFLMDSSIRKLYGTEGEPPSSS